MTEKHQKQWQFSKLFCLFLLCVYACIPVFFVHFSLYVSVMCCPVTNLSWFQSMLIIHCQSIFALLVRSFSDSWLLEAKIFAVADESKRVLLVHFSSLLMGGLKNLYSLGCLSVSQKYIYLILLAGLSLPLPYRAWYLQITNRVRYLCDVAVVIGKWQALI